MFSFDNSNEVADSDISSDFSCFFLAGNPPPPPEAIDVLQAKIS